MQGMTSASQRYNFPVTGTSMPTHLASPHAESVASNHRHTVPRHPREHGIRARLEEAKEPSLRQSEAAPWVRTVPARLRPEEAKASVLGQRPRAIHKCHPAKKGARNDRCAQRDNASNRQGFLLFCVGRTNLRSRLKMLGLRLHKVYPCNKQI